MTDNDTLAALPPTMTNDEAHDWLLGLLNATPPPRDAAALGAAIRAIRAKAIAKAIADAPVFAVIEHEARRDALAQVRAAVAHVALLPNPAGTTASQSTIDRLRDYRAAVLDAIDGMER